MVCPEGLETQGPRAESWGPVGLDSWGPDGPECILGAWEVICLWMVWGHGGAQSMVMVCSEDFATQEPRAESWGPRDLMA